MSLLLLLRKRSRIGMSYSEDRRGKKRWVDEGLLKSCCACLLFLFAPVER